MYINNLITGTMTLGSGGSTPSYHEETWYKYAGDTEWGTVNIIGVINHGEFYEDDGVDAYNSTE